jgi:DNA mismatch endonuclease (patch repair protein)
MERDEMAVNALHGAGWRVLIIWECAFRGPARVGKENVLETACKFLLDMRQNLQEIRGDQTSPGLISGAGNRTVSPAKLA